ERGALEDEIAGGRERAAIPIRAVLDGPARLARDRIPREQATLVWDLERLGLAIDRRECKVVRHRSFDRIALDRLELVDIHRALLVVAAVVLRREIDQAGVRAVRHRLPVVAAKR